MGVALDPLSFVESEAPRADGQKVVCQQPLQSLGVCIESRPVELILQCSVISFIAFISWSIFSKPDHRNPSVVLFAAQNRLIR